MATRIISTRISVDGEKEYKQQMSSVNSELKTLKTEMSLTEAEFRGQANSVEALTAKDKILRQEVEQQQEKVRALEQAVADATGAYGENDKRTDQWKQSLNRAKTELIKLNDQLDDNSRYLDEAKRSSDKTAKSIDEFGKEVKDAGGGMADFIGNLKNMKNMLLGSAIAVGIKEIARSVMDLEESTREYRQILGTLETSGQAAGYAAEETSAAYERLYGILGDTQSTATTVANLQAIGLEQETLMQLIDQVTGAWATYGDSIPIDGLAESVNETIKAQQVTGTFADVLNWGTKEGETFGITMRESTEANKEWNDAVADCKSAEDYFNLALQQCSSDSERVNLVMQAMASQGLAQTSEAWRQNNEDIIAANESQNKLDAAMARLGEKLAPLSSDLKSLGADAINELIDWGEKAAHTFSVDMPSSFYGMVESLNQKLDEMGTLMDETIDEFKQAGKDVVNGFIEGVKDKWNTAVENMKDFGGDILESVKSVLGIHSPSKEFMTIGEFIMEGLAIGMENRKGDVMETADDILGELKSRFDDLSKVLETRQDVEDLQYQLWEMTDGINASEIEKYTKHLDILSQKERDQAAIVEAADIAYQSVAEQYGENSEESLSYQKVLLQEQIAYEELLKKIQEVMEAKEQLMDLDAAEVSGVDNYGKVDGSHASGLARVPYDGYIAELHRDERILTAAESKVWDSIQRGDTSAGSNISVQDLRDVMAASVNAMGAIGQGGSYKVDVHMDIDGKEFYRTTIDDLRAVQKSTPEARDDR